MSTQICPKCKSDSFTWFIDDEISELIIWGCYSCGYRAYENEALERICLHCKIKTELYLKDDEKEYWWCPSCNRIQLLK